MSEAKITPLARRLAEENGIDWRRLNGTGPENTVVERDILGFLAKVMAGEVSLPPTVEEAAPPPDSIPNMAQAQAMLQKEGVQLGDLMPSIAAPSTAKEPPKSQPTLDDLDFDFDFDSEPEMAPPVEPFSPPAPKSPTLLEMAPEPDLPKAPPQPVVEAKLPSLEPPGLAPAESAHPELDGLPALPELEPPLPSPESPKLVWETQEVLPSAPTPAPEPLHGGMSFSSAPAPQAPPIQEELPPLPPLPELPPLDQHSAPAPAALHENREEAATPAPEVVPSAPGVTPSVPQEPQPVNGAMPLPPMPPVAVPAEVPHLAASAPAEAPASQAQTTAPKMVRLQAWQRMVLVQPAIEATQTLSEAWRTEVPLYALLYRAVDKALSDTQLPMRATKGHLDGEELRSHRVMPTQTLRGTLDSLQDASEPGEGLAVLSLVDGPFDQVVFPGAALLTLGRAQGDQALLTLSAEVSHQEAGALLERIGYYLERPILLA